MKKITDKNPEIRFEHVINKYGKIDRYYYNPNNILTEFPNRDKSQQIKEGQLFPEFVFKTIDNEIIDSEKQRGKWVLIRFELFTRFMNKGSIEKLNNQINKLEESKDLISIICLADNKQNIKNEMALIDSNFKLVDGGRNFHEKFNIVGFPTTLLLDKQGRVYKYFYNRDEIDLEALFK